MKRTSHDFGDLQFSAVGGIQKRQCSIDKQEQLDISFGLCSRRGCPRAGYKLGKICAYHLMMNYRYQLGRSHPDLAAEAAPVLTLMATISNVAELDRLFEETKQHLKIAKKQRPASLSCGTAKPKETHASFPSFVQSALQSATKPAVKSAVQTSTVYSRQKADAVSVQSTETHKESVTQRQRHSTSESKVIREKRPDGTVIEHEVSRTRTSENEVEFKREAQRAVKLLFERVASEQHQWTKHIQTESGWNGLRSSVQERCVSDRFATCLFRHHDEPLEQCIDKHESQLAALVVRIQSQKPSEVTLESKAKWLLFAYEQVRLVYPQTAWAFFRCYVVFNGAWQIKLMDKTDAEEYERLRATKRLPCVSVPYSRLKNISTLSRKSLQYIEKKKAFPLPRTTLDAELIDIKNAFQLYCTYEHLLRKSGTRLSLLGKRIYQIHEFVEEFMEGNYTRLFYHIVSIHVSWRVSHSVDVTGFMNVRVLSNDGVTNEYVEMQDKDAVVIPFYNPDQGIRLGWVRLSVQYLNRGRFELILPDFVGIRLFGAPVERWHKDHFCPAIAHAIALQPAYQETSFVHLDGQEIPRSVLENSEEFATVLRLHDQINSPDHSSASVFPSGEVSITSLPVSVDCD